jgi:virginiamycin B lyase
MKRLIGVAVALFSLGCSSHSVAPLIGYSLDAPQVIQRQPCCGSPDRAWVFAALPPFNGFNVTPFDLVSDEKSKVWFVDNFGQLGYVTMDQKVTMFTLKNANPYALTLGPDGNFWVADFHGSIARVTPSGVETDFTTSMVHIVSITNGPDGALWFGGCRNHCFIGRMTTEGTYRTYSFGLTAYPNSITSGPDGNLWIADDNGAIHRFTTRGVDTVYPVPGHPVDIIAGSDGALYFSENDGIIFGRVTTSGSVTIISQPNGHLMGGIVNGPGHQIWAGVGVNVIGTYDPSTYKFGPAIQTPTDSKNSNAHIGNLTTGPDNNMWATFESGLVTYVRQLMTVSPSRVNLETSGDTAVLNVKETAYRGTWTASTSASAVATVVQISPGAFVVTAVGIGHCYVTIKDGNGNFAPVFVTVQ